jgi:hypothetical protein
LLTTRNNEKALPGVLVSSPCPVDLYQFIQGEISMTGAQIALALAREGANVLIVSDTLLERD